LKNGMRESSHVLLIGDPGQGKSQLLQFAHQLSDRGAFVTGTATSSVGLTGCVGDGLEAGAVVISDQGVCCTAFK
jgi:DNA replicative helicase MCM subunit Mcm2 (Cdc46/Mcm family)